MIRLLFTLLVTSISYSSLLLASKLELTANAIYSEEDTVHASEGVVVYYDDAIIKASRATYNKKTKLLILDDKVEMIRDDGTKELMDHMELHTDTKKAELKHLFLSGENDIWLLTNHAKKNVSSYKLGRSMLSSCDVNDPLWKMSFTDALFNSENKYMKVYNAWISFWNIPIFYTPYLAFSTNKKRTSGLLFPKIGYTPLEGVLLEQPIFWNIAQNMDLEFNPQIRTKRSLGLYSTFRFVDSNHSSGVLRAGYFKDKQTYRDTYNPQNNSHYGIEFNYESSQLLTKDNDKSLADGLYVNLTYLNDIDYLNLQKSRLSHFGTRPRQESRVNYFIYNDNYYAGLNAKYFIDTRETNNDSTLQVLPSLQWHKYLKTLVWDNLTYSIDAHVSNVTRKVGATMRQAEVKVPVEYSTSFFNDYVNLSLSDELYYSRYAFGNGTFEYDNFQYYSNIQKASIFTDLTKRYIDFIHVLQPSIEYVNPKSDHESPIGFDALSSEQKKLFTVGLPEESVSFGLKQYFYDDDMNLFFFQRLFQRYYPNRAYKLSELENEMQYTWDAWNFYNYTLYSNKYKDIHAMVNSIDLEGDGYNLSLGHSFKKELSSESKNILVNDLNLNFRYMINQRIRMSGGFTYDIENSESKQWKIGLGYFRDCWSIDASYRQDIRATSSGPEKLNTLYLQLNFIPFGGIGTGDFK